MRRYRHGDASVDAYAEDYAYLIFGLLELFQAGGDPEWLEWALQLQERQDALFWDACGWWWFSTTGQGPVGSVAAERGLRRSRAGGQFGLSAQSADAGASVCGRVSRLRRKIRQTLGAFASRAGQMGRSVPMMLAALSTYHAGMPQVVIVGPSTPVGAGEQGEGTAELKEVLRNAYLPTAIAIILLPQHRETLARLLPWIDSMKAVEGRATAYVCRDFACQTPATSPAQLGEQLHTYGSRR
jgi:uncharacterized protein YyaL (SSP411 family)